MAPAEDSSASSCGWPVVARPVSRGAADLVPSSPAPPSPRARCSALPLCLDSGAPSAALQAFVCVGNSVHRAFLKRAFWGFLAPPLGLCSRCLLVSLFPSPLLAGPTLLALCPPPYVTARAPWLLRTGASEHLTPCGLPSAQALGIVWQDSGLQIGLTSIWTVVPIVSLCPARLWDRWMPWFGVLCVGRCVALQAVAPPVCLQAQRSTCGAPSGPSPAASRLGLLESLWLLPLCLLCSLCCPADLSSGLLSCFPLT